MKKNILITGLPGSGKSTILKKIISLHEAKVGFVTHEVCQDGARTGFELETNAGEKSMLASVKFQTEFKVKKYFVDVTNLDQIIPRVTTFKSEDLLFLDEIGQMQLFSDKFKQLVSRYLDSPNICLATLSKVYDDPFIETVKNRDDVILVEISPENRDSKMKFLEALVQKILKAKRYFRDPQRFSIKSDEVTIRTDHGIRHLRKNGSGWICDCEFFKEYSLCSHWIALDEYLRSLKTISGASIFKA